MKALSILLIDDHQLFRYGFIKTLQNASEWNYKFAEAGSGTEALTVLDEHSFDIIFLDVHMSGMDGYQTATQILARWPNSKLILLSEHDELSVIFHFFKMGITGFLLKDCNVEIIHHAIRSMLLNDYYYHSQFKNQLDFLIRNPDGFSTYSKFTKREKQLIKLMVEGMSNQEIADKLEISIRSVEDHRYNLIHKTKSKNTAQLVLYAIKSGML